MKTKAILSVVCSSLLIISRLVSAADSLTPGNPVEVTGTQGKFDFIKIDSANNRLLACHPGNGAVSRVAGQEAIVRGIDFDKIKLPLSASHFHWVSWSQGICRRNEARYDKER